MANIENPNSKTTHLVVKKTTRDRVKDISGQLGMGIGADYDKTINALCDFFDTKKQK